MRVYFLDFWVNPTNRVVGVVIEEYMDLAIMHTILTLIRDTSFELNCVYSLDKHHFTYVCDSAEYTTPNVNLKITKSDKSFVSVG